MASAARPTPLEAVAGSDLIVLSIKPGTLGKVLRQIRGAVRPQQVVMSIVAGARAAAISQALGRPAIIRCVPSLPSLNEAVTATYARTLEIGNQLDGELRGEDS